MAKIWLDRCQYVFDKTESTILSAINKDSTLKVILVGFAIVKAHITLRTVTTIHLVLSVGCLKIQ